jgi:hypothetical protein
MQITFSLAKFKLLNNAAKMGYCKKGGVRLDRNAHQFTQNGVRLDRNGRLLPFLGLI